MRVWPLAVGFVALLASTAIGDELTPAERTWARSCVTGLTASSARQRESAAAALARLGPSAVPAIVSAVSVLKTDEHWAALESALVGMGAAGALKELEKTERDWPVASSARRTTLMEHLRSAAKAPEVPAGALGKAPPKSPEDIAARVRSILESFDGESTYSTQDRRIAALVELGRPAVSAMLADLVRDGSHSFRSEAAAEALKSLLVVDDVPTVARILEAGHLGAAPALAKLPADVVVPALIAPLAKGFNDFALVEGLKPFKNDKRVQGALITWLAGDPDGSGSSLIGSTADLLAQADARDAVPALLAILDHGVGPMNRRQVAEALTTLGEKRGIGVLLEIFRSSTSERAGYDGHAAGERLNAIAGRRIYRGTFEPGGRAVGNFGEAVFLFDQWWAEVKDSIRYDFNLRAWVTK